MRIISGEFRGYKLESVKSDKTRPTLDRVREALFSSLMNYLEGARVLDLFSGTGALGLESISRGAKYAVLNDKSQDSFKAILANVNNMKCNERVQISKKEADKCIAKMAKENEKFDIIFLDPPYLSNLGVKSIENIVMKGRIYTGPLKAICVPGLNCYSCPGALGSCPIGSLQAVIGSAKYQFSFYVAGIIMMFGAIMGRFVCGFLCPFGLLQDLLHKIPFPKKIRTFWGDKILRYLKYIILLVFVILLPMFVVDVVGQASPFFCKYICPSGIFMGGIPLVASNPMLRDALGFLFTWKTLILVVTILISIIIYRPFCKYICPLGALYGLCNPISITGLKLDKEKCINCGKCAKACGMVINPVEKQNSTECIRCGKCIDVCPTKALTFGFRIKKQKTSKKFPVSK